LYCELTFVFVLLKRNANPLLRAKESRNAATPLALNKQITWTQRGKKKELKTSHSTMGNTDREQVQGEHAESDGQEVSISIAKYAKKPAADESRGGGGGEEGGGGGGGGSGGGSSSSLREIKRCVVQLGVFNRGTSTLLNIGSGSMVSCKGHILTAAHNVLDANTSFTTVVGSNSTQSIEQQIENCTLLVGMFSGDTEPTRWAYTARIVSTAAALTAKLSPSSYPELSTASLLDIAVLQITATVETAPPSFSGLGSVNITEEGSKLLEDVFYLQTNTAPGALEVGSEVALYGYPLGHAKQGGLVHLRIAAGTAAVSQLVAGFVLVNATAVAASGLSGGPLLNQSGEIVGIMSHDYNDSYLKGTHLTGTTNFSWFRRLSEVLEGHGMPTQDMLPMALAVQLNAEEGKGRAAAGVPGTHEFETVHNIPFPPDTNYIDHKETGDSVGLTSRIRQMLDPQQGNGSGHGHGSGGGFSNVTYAALTQVAAAGLGGIGKTHAVIQVVHAEVEQGTFDYILWVSAESAVTLHDGFERIAKEMLKLPVADGNTDKCRKLVLDWMQTTHSRWLLVLDNADNTATVKEYLPMTAHEGCGHVVLTTRTSEEHLKQQLQRNFATLTVTKLSDVEAMELLLRGTKGGNTSSGTMTLSPAEVEALEGLVEALDGLPLALAQARDYMAVNKSTFVEYKKLYDVESTRVFEKEELDSARALHAWLQQLELEEHEPKLRSEIGVRSLQKLVLVNDEDLKEIGMPVIDRRCFLKAAEAGVEVPMQTNTVARTWRINFNALTPASQQLLECLSLLAPDDIPDTLVPALARAEVLAGGALSKGLRNADGSDCTEEGQRLCMNRLLNELTQYSLVQRRAFSGSMSGGESGEAKAGGSSRPSTWLSMHRLVQQVQRDSVFSYNNDVGGATVGGSAGVRAEIVWGGCVQAMAVVFEFDEDLHETWQQSYGMGVHAESLLGLHARYGTTGCLVEGAGLASTLSHAFHSRCEYDRARAYAEQALVMHRQVHGAEAAHADIAMVLGNLGSACSAEGDNKAARKYHEQSLAMHRRLHGAEAAHANTATALGNLGTVCSDEGDSKAARKYYEQSLAMYSRVHGTEAAHADIAMVLTNLGTVCHAEGDSKAARKYHEQSLAMNRQVHGAEAVHADKARVLTNLGNVCRAEGDSKAALS
jgi:tetratricopeptide (TPR) repeat protein/S1-C subfamily serine protease